MDQQASASASAAQTPEEDIHQRAAELVAALQNPEEMATEDIVSAISNAYEAMAEWRQEWVTLQRSTSLDALAVSPSPKPRTRGTSNEDSMASVGPQDLPAVAADPAFVASSEFSTLPSSASAPILRPAPDSAPPVRRKRGRPRKDQSTPSPNPRTRAISNEDSMAAIATQALPAVAADPAFVASSEFSTLPSSASAPILRPAPDFAPPVRRKRGRPRKDQSNPSPNPRTGGTSNEDSMAAITTQALPAVAADPVFVASSEFSTLPSSASAPILRSSPVSTHTHLSSPDFTSPVRRKRGRPRKDQSAPPPNPRTRATSNEDSMAANATRALPAVAADPAFVPSTEFSTLPYSASATTLHPAPVSTHTHHSSPGVTPPVRRKRGRPRKDQSTAASAPAPAKAQAKAKVESSKGMPAAGGNNGKGGVEENEKS